MTVGFTLDGEKFTALNGGPQFPFTEAVSLMVNCESQEEVNYFWEKLSAGGKEVQCGWLQDGFGLSWQIVPTEFFELISKGSQEQSHRVMAAMMEMVKMDLAKLKKAYNGN
jgi:predicted 3-demethylubiquinone-9 3-methyltransferase (glyoxalase superfamily)